MTTTCSGTIAAVIVIYNPGDEIVSHLTNILKGVDFVIAVNNGANSSICKRLTRAGIIVVGDGENIGLSRALNLGLDAAWKLAPHAHHVLLLDQDSQPAKSMARRLQLAFEKARAAGLNPACVAPRLIDVKARSKNLRQRPGLAEIELAATSGTLTSREVVQDVGGMMADLFIDCIDHEWCFRARHLGYKIYQDNDTVMLHDMGELAVNIPMIYKPMYKSPIRHYYIIRNTLLLFRKNYVPFKWKAINLIKTCYRIIAYVAASTDRSASLHLITQALIDGSAGRSESRPVSITKHAER